LASIHKADLVKLAEGKLLDARLLLQNGRSSSAYYIAGYAVEIGLKAIIAGEFRNDTLPDKTFANSVYTHKLEELVRLAGLASELNARKRGSPEFDSNWAVVANWSEQARYDATDAITATAMLHAVGDDQTGVLPWLKTYW
jgi:hypothetical protein